MNYTVRRRQFSGSRSAVPALFESDQDCGNCVVWEVLSRKWPVFNRYAACSCPTGMRQAAKRFTELRAWQACNAYKQAIYRMCAEGPLSRDWERRRQLEDSVAGPPEHIAESFGRFNPTEFTRFTATARSSLMESRDHLRNAVDKRYITDAFRRELDGLAEEALREVTELIESLQRDSSRPFRRVRSTHPDSCEGTAGDSPRRNRTAVHRRSPL